MTRRILSDVATHPWSSAAFVACAVATVALLAGLDSPAMWVLCSVLVAVLVAALYAVRPPAADVVVPQQRDGGAS